MALDDARRLERDHLRAHLALAQPPVSHDQPDWVRDRP